MNKAEIAVKILVLCIVYIYTRLKKRCLVISINNEQCDTMELWEDGTGKFVTGFRFFMFKVFSFQGNLTSKLRHAVLL